MIVLKKRHLSLLCIAALSGFGFALPSHAASLTSEGHAAGAQCNAKDVNDGGTTVGTCTFADNTGLAIAWVSNTVGTETPLQPLARAQPCGATGITNGGVIVGRCADANNKWFAVIWHASTYINPPAQLLPLAVGVLGLTVGDISTHGSAFNQNGAVVGVSYSAKGDRTAVFWPAGSTSPVPVSTLADNCVAADMNETLVNGFPTIVLNCPNPSVPGTVTARYAQSGLLGYAMTNLAVPAGYSYCRVSSINDNAQIVGTCHTATSDHPDSVLWPSPSSAPDLLSLPGNPSNGAGAINANGDFTFAFQDTNGNTDSGVYISATNTVYEFPTTVCGGTRATITGLGDNDTVSMVCEDSAENSEAAYATYSGGSYTLNAAGFEGGGQDSSLDTISKSGNYAVGEAENSAQNVDAVVTSLP